MTEADLCKHVRYESDNSLSAVSDFYHDSPVPGFAGTADVSSDERYIVDWKTPVHT